MLSSQLTLFINGVASTADAVDDRIVRSALISLFSWRRANADDVTEGQRMGWWGDTTADISNDRIGSRLWLLAREKIVPATINRAREYANEALAWMVEDGLASRVDVQVERFGIDGLAMTATIYRTDGEVSNLRFDNLWENIRNAV